MSSHFQCRCGALFHANEAIKHDETGEGYFLLCPHCESEDLEDAWLCEVCGVRKADVDGCDMCSVCARAEDEVIKTYEGMHL